MAVTTDTVAKLIGTAVESHNLLADLPAVWRTQLHDPKAAAEIAALLKIDAQQLKELVGPPIDLQQEQSGLAVSEILVLVATWVATDVVLKALADLGKDAVKDAIRKLWVRYLKPGLEDLQDEPRALGDEVDADLEPPKP